MRLKHCHNFHDYREIARRRLPGPNFDYIDGGADDEVTLRKNTKSFEHRANCVQIGSIKRILKIRKNRT